MSVLDLSTRLCNRQHAFGAKRIRFRKGSRFVVGTLVYCGIAFFVRFDDVVFQFAHRFKLHTGDFAKSLGRFEQRLFRGGSQRTTIFVKVGAKQAKGRNLSEGVDKGGRETGEHIKIAAARSDETEKARTVDALATT